VRADTLDTTTRAYIPSLDGIRAVAVLGVMAYHLRAFVVPDSSWLPRGGYLGVDLFFVLSGFLITSLLLAEREQTGSVRFRGFYRRRAFRLFPAMVAFVIVQAAAAAAAGQSLTDEVHFWLGALTYTSNWVMTAWSVPANTGHVWSLAVEEQFYLVWPVLLVVVARLFGRRAIAVVAATGVVIAVVIRAVLTHRWGTGYPIVYLHTEARMDSLLVGALLAYTWEAGWRPRRSTAQVAGWTGAAVVGWYVLFTNPTDTFLYTQAGYTVLALAAAALILGALDDRWTVTRLLSLRPLIAIGRLSYSLYLWHMLVLFVLLSFLQHHGTVARVVVYTGASFTLAWISYRYVEHPLRGFGRRPLRVREAAPEPASVARKPRAVGRSSKPAFALAGAGALALVVLGVVPAYAARDAIRGRDEAVARALAREHAIAAGAVDPISQSATAGTVDSVPASASVFEPEATGPAGSGSDSAAASSIGAGTGVAPVASVLRIDAPSVDPSDPLTPRLVFAATLQTAGGTALEGRSVEFTSDIGTCRATTDSGGHARCTVPAPAPPPGVDTSTVMVTATFAGDASTAAARASWPA